MAAYARHDTAFFSQRAVFFIAIVLVHIGLLYLFQSGLATRIINTVAPPLETSIVQEVQKRDVPPPPPPPKMERPPVEVPPPDVVINIPVETQSTAITNTTTKHVAPPPPAPPKPVVRKPATVVKMPNPQDFYPPTSIRMSETGSVLIKVCWGTDGKVSKTPTVEKSSGSSRLDEAAARLGRDVRMKPASIDGKPIEGCSTLPVKFVLN